MARTKKQADRKMCISEGCKNPKVLTSFYSTNSPMFPDGKVPLCKKCIQEQIEEDDINSVKRILRQIDKPYIHNLWNDCVEDERETFGWYMRMINSLPQYKKMTYEDSVSEDEYNDSQARKSKGNSKSRSKVNNDVEDIEEIVDEDGETIEISNNIRAKYGSGYTNREYLQMEKFYLDMDRSYDISTPNHKELLIEMAQLNIDKKRLRASGDYGDYKRVADAYKDLMKDAGFRPADRVAGNESSGIRSFSQVYDEIEKEGFIPPYPIQENPDIVDRTILYMENNFRSLMNVDRLTNVPEDAPKLKPEEIDYSKNKIMVNLDELDINSTDVEEESEEGEQDE